MAAAPVRQRSGPAGPRAQLPPCYYEGYLEKRGPKEKVGSPRCRPSAMLFPMHAVDSGGQCVCARSTPADLPFPESCQLPYCVRNGRGETEHWCWWGMFNIADHRFVVLLKVCLVFLQGSDREACSNVWTNHNVWQHCHLNPITGRICGSPLHLNQASMSAKYFHRPEFSWQRNTLLFIYLFWQPDLWSALWISPIQSCIK